MKKIFLLLFVASLSWIGLPSSKATAVAQHRPSCREVYEYLLNHMRACPSGESCIAFSANLTNLLVDVEADGDQVYGCQLNGTSSQNLYIAGYPATGSLGAMVGSTYDDNMASVELREKYSSFVYAVRERVVGQRPGLFSIQYFDLSYALDSRRGNQTKKIYFTSFTVNGVVEPATPPPPTVAEACPVPAPLADAYTLCEQGDNLCGFCNEAGTLALCLDSAGNTIDCPMVNANGANNPGGPRPPGIERLNEANLNNTTNNGGASTGGGCMSLNKSASPKNVWFGFGELFIMSFILMALRNRGRR